MTGWEPCQVLNFPFLPAREIFPFTSLRMSKDKLYYGASLYHQVQSQGEDAEASEEKSLLGALMKRQGGIFENPSSQGSNYALSFLSTLHTQLGSGRTRGTMYLPLVYSFQLLTSAAETW